MNKKILFGILSFIFTFIVAFSYWWLATPRALTFSDSARYANAARSLTQTGTSMIHHSYFSRDHLSPDSFLNGWTFNSSPITIKTLSLVFKFFPSTDLTVTILGIIIFSLSGTIIFLIASNLYSYAAGLLAVTLFSFNPFLLSYAVNHASEIYLVLEILLATYFIFTKRNLKILALIPTVLMLYTRPQSLVFIVGLIFFYSLSRLYQKSKQPLKLIAIIISVISLLVLVFLTLSHLALTRRWSVSIPHFGSIFIPTIGSPGQFLRGVSLSQTNLSVFDLVSKVFYNSYNFLKDPSRLINPGIFWLFILGVISSTSKQITKFNLLACLSLIFFILAVSITLPNARYIHPITPLLIIGASIFLVNLLKKYKLKYQTLTLFVLTVFLTLPVWGNILIDHRFRSQNFNLDKPPIYQAISTEIQKHTSAGEIILTNLDAWAAWYSGLTTMWFPISPDMLDIPSSDIKYAKYIAITNYKESDGDFALGQWAEVVYSPHSLNNQFLNQHYSVLTTFTIQADQVYENKSYQGTILIKN